MTAVRHKVPDGICVDCKKHHPTMLDALRCDERLADACRCGQCRACINAAQWRAHPKYVRPK